jgi:hypothetical protein
MGFSNGEQSLENQGDSPASDFFRKFSTYYAIDGLVDSAFSINRVSNEGFFVCH